MFYHALGTNAKKAMPLHRLWHGNDAAWTGGWSEQPGFSAADAVTYQTSSVPKSLVQNVFRRGSGRKLCAESINAKCAVTTGPSPSVRGRSRKPKLMRWLSAVIRLWILSIGYSTISRCSSTAMFSVILEANSTTSSSSVNCFSEESTQIWSAMGIGFMSLKWGNAKASTQMSSFATRTT